MFEIIIFKLFKINSISIFYELFLKLKNHMKKIHLYFNYIS